MLENKAVRQLPKLAKGLCNTVRKSDGHLYELTCGTLCIGAIVDYQEYLPQHSKAMAQIAAVLPGVDIKVLRFPREEATHAGSALCAKYLQIIHFITPVFRPAPLRFNHILGKVDRDDIAIKASQAKQRDIKPDYKVKASSRLPRTHMRDSVLLNSQICRLVNATRPARLF
ncbi:hypothetical protein HYFRA_00004502 [Hymenoscyphus fraxineus]|uniref:Uncharacterized protein n=1 Tax=Hymenoscyphus fraxineus TaxID=746836 RepID=A0A9N9KYT5_9HELO|nr:hypothetical protein HYFRA_00004502 [Hymenoscyphus fraxineus]